MITKLADNIWKITCDSNLYLVKDRVWLAIDAGNRQFHDEVAEDIKSIVDPKKISKVLFTHLHYDHIGNIDLFPNSVLYAHKDEIASLKADPEGTVLSDGLIDTSKLDPAPLPKRIGSLEVIHSPGHTKGSVCFYLRKEKILFSGDTLFSMHSCGRTDLPSSVPEKLKPTLDMLYGLEVEMLCPGHDYDL